MVEINGIDKMTCAIATLVYVLIRGGCLPLRVQVEQVHEEVVGQRLGPAGEDAVLGLSEVGVQGAHAANQDRHLGSGQRPTGWPGPAAAPPPVFRRR